MKSDDTPAASTQRPRISARWTVASRGGCSVAGQEVSRVARRSHRGRNLRAGQAFQWTDAWSHDQGLRPQVMGTIDYPKTAKPMSRQPLVDRMRETRTERMERGVGTQDRTAAPAP